MSDISQIQVNGTTYDLCDATSRTQIANLQDSVILSGGKIHFNQNNDTFSVWFTDGKKIGLTLDSSSILAAHYNGDSWAGYDRITPNYRKSFTVSTTGSGVVLDTISTAILSQITRIDAIFINKNGYVYPPQYGSANECFRVFIRGNGQLCALINVPESNLLPITVKVALYWIN